MTALTFYYVINFFKKSPKLQPLKFGRSFTWMKILSFITIIIHEIVIHKAEKVFLLVFCLWSFVWLGLFYSLD